MRSTITLLIGLSTVLLFLSIYGIPYVNGQASNPNNKTSNENSDPFLPRGSDNNINTDSTNNPSQANDGSTDKNNNDGCTDKNNNDGSTDKNNNDGSTDKNNNDGSTDKNNHDNKKGSDNSKSSVDNKGSKSKDNGKKFELPFP
jgi:hypothetical protein